MEKVYAEMGIGNETFLSTEFEKGEAEYRVPRFILPKKIKGCYLRFWIKKKVYIFSSRDGFKIQHKNRREIKILFGISGVGK